MKSESFIIDNVMYTMIYDKNCDMARILENLGNVNEKIYNSFQELLISLFVFGNVLFCRWKT